MVYEKCNWTFWWTKTTFKFSINYDNAAFCTYIRWTDKSTWPNCGEWIFKNNKIYGYAYAGAFKGRRAYDWSVETSIYVKAGISNHGVGTLLYKELERYLKLQNIINVNACITYPNEQSENFHKKFGYKVVAHFTKCGYKFGEWKDMIWMEKFIAEHNIPPKAMIPFSKLNLG